MIDSCIFVVIFFLKIPFSCGTLAGGGGAGGIFDNMDVCILCIIRWGGGYLFHIGLILH